MITRLPGNVILLRLSDMDSNIYLIGDTAIDAGTGFNFTRLRDLFRIMKQDMGAIKLVVNTHGHYDHVGGNGYFLNAAVAIHKADAEILEKGDSQLAAADFFDGKLRPRKVDRKLEHGEKIKAGSLELEVIHSPGHTHGSICLFARKEGILFTGDVVFKDGIGRTDFANSDPEQMVDSLEALKALPVKQVFPGHGEPFDGKLLKNLFEETEDYNERV